MRGGGWPPASWVPKIGARLLNGEQDFNWLRQAGQAAQGREMALVEARTGNV